MKRAPFFDPNCEKSNFYKDLERVMEYGKKPTE
jgi:hypothetical protein